MRKSRRAITIIKERRAIINLINPVFRVMYRHTKNTGRLFGDLEASGYQDDQMYFLPGMLVLKLEDGEVRWMVFSSEFKMEIWKN